MGKKLEGALKRLPLNDELKSYIRLKIKNPSVQNEERDAILFRILGDLLTGGTEQVKVAALDLQKSFSSRTKSFKQTFIEKNPGILVWEVDSYLAILEKHAGGKRDTSGAARCDGKRSTRRTEGINAALDEIIKSRKALIKDTQGEREVEVPVDEKLIQVIRWNRKKWLEGQKFFESLKNIACDIFAEKHNFAYERTTEIYREYKPQPLIAETGNRIAEPGYFNKDFKLLPNKSNVLRNCRHSLLVPYNPETIIPTPNKKDSIPGAKLSAKKRK